MLSRHSAGSAPATTGNGAREIVGTGKRDWQFPKLTQIKTQVIRAELHGSSEACALGLTARGHAPVLKLCRLLVEAGYDPGAQLEACRGDLRALLVNSIGDGARLEINGRGTGFRWCRAVDTGPPVCGSGLRASKSLNIGGVFLDAVSL